MGDALRKMDEVAIEDGRLQVDRDRLKLERQKLALEVMLKRREVAAGHRGAFGTLLSNPLALAVVGGFVSLMTTIGSGFYTARQNRIAEEHKAELARMNAQEGLQAELIKKFTEGPRPVVRDNLKFLLEAGLLPSYAKRIEAYLLKNPDAAPQAASIGGIQGRDDAVTIDQLPRTDPIVRVSQSVGQLRVGRGASCTAFLIAPDRALTAGFCVTSGAKNITLRLADRTWPVSLLRQREGSGVDDGGYAVLALRGDTQSLVGLRLASAPPIAGQQLKVVMFRAGLVPLMVGSPDCRVLSVAAISLQHRCDTGAGSAGAPILAADDQTVVGIHAGRDQSGNGFATLTSKIRTR